MNVRKFWVRDPDVFKNGKDDRSGTMLGHPRMLVAFEVVDGTVLYATATWCPGDTFNRKQASDRAEGRLRSRRKDLMFTLPELRVLSTEFTPRQYVELKRAIVLDVILQLHMAGRENTKKWRACSDASGKLYVEIRALLDAEERAN